jgi:hypothetical protein
LLLPYVKFITSTPLNAAFIEAFDGFSLLLRILKRRQVFLLIWIINTRFPPINAIFDIFQNLLSSRSIFRGNDLPYFLIDEIIVCAFWSFWAALE